MTNSSYSAVDYTGAPLRIGQDVAFIAARDGQAGRPRLYTGEIKLIGEYQIVVASGERFFTLEGEDMRTKVEENVVIYWEVMGHPAA
ncbi:hypothetical protein E6R18_24960 [Streptomyces sp. A1277]|uniref:hypothetical protein n=1 Tax=Streptomyces sp. A1277 TaxID=2563103 RepID=UPI0010A25252|nr:hypothetical protein [Streptomyces sp. A1277]THA29165.1 hypothetical protein E6R18_24960 [Streptomyces sp. A1277]